MMKEKWMAYKKKAILPAGILSCILILAIAAGVIAGGSNAGQTVYRETTAVKGNLTVGITESGTVDIGTTTQTFELDMSKLKRNNSSSDGSGSNSTGMGSGGGMMGGMDMFSQIFDFASDGTGQDSSAGGSTLTIEEVAVSVGQQVKAGDVLYTLEEDTLSEIRERLEADVDKANADLEAVYASQKQSRLEAQYNYDTGAAYGSYASTEMEASIKELEEEASNKAASLEVAKQELLVYQERLEQAQEEYTSAKEMLERCEWGVNNVNKQEDIYLYVQYESMRTQAESTSNSLESEIEQLESDIEKAQDTIASLEKESKEAQRALLLGQKEAKKNYDLRMLAYNTTEETYDIALSYLELSSAEQEDAYAEAKERWEEFQSNINENAICAAYDGVITDVHLKAGDSIGTKDKVVTLYNLDEVTMKLTVDEEDMEDIKEGTQANVVLTAYPDQPFRASVTELSDAKTDANGDVTYKVTVTIEGDTSGLYQGMTGDVTFITRETQEVLYVSNRSITRSGGTSYVKVKDENGSIKSKEVVTGFSDGVNVEIVEGLSEGDVVLIESKVSD